MFFNLYLQRSSPNVNNPFNFFSMIPFQNFLPKSCCFMGDWLEMRVQTGSISQVWKFNSFECDPLALDWLIAEIVRLQKSNFQICLFLQGVLSNNFKRQLQ